MSRSLGSADRFAEPGSKAEIFGLLGFFSVVAGLRFWTSLLSAEPLGDELIYLEAFIRLAEGQSPYQGEYFYPPCFAIVGAALWQLGGEPLVLGLLRLANTLGLAALVTASLWLWRSGRSQKLWIGAGVILLSPAVALGMEWGNLSLWAAGVTIPAVLGFRRHPWASGLTLTVVVAIKPLAAVAVAVVLADRWCLLRPWRRPWTGATLREWLLVAMLVLTQLASLALGARYLQDFLAQSAGWPEATRSVSVHRLLYLAGLEIDSLVIFVVVVVSAVAFVGGAYFLGLPPLFRGETATDESPSKGTRAKGLLGKGILGGAPGNEELLAVAVVASLLATPLVWAHTLLLALPIQMLAVRRLLTRHWAGAVGNDAQVEGFQGRSRFYEAAAVALAILACHWVEGTGGIDDRSALVQGLVQLFPAMSTPLLLVYLFRTHRNG